MFTGFTDETVDFMWGIRFNNERTWFEAHKDVYLTQFYQPMRELSAELYDFIRQTARKNGVEELYIFYHTCGAMKPLAETLRSEGVDILNPVQVSASGMDSKELKRDIGDMFTFWGGGVDTQQILPHGTPQQVKDEVRRRIDDFAPGGGFVFAAVHNVQSDVPPENYMAMWDALREYGVYDKK